MWSKRSLFLHIRGRAGARRRLPIFLLLPLFSLPQLLLAAENLLAFLPGKARAICTGMADALHGTLLCMLALPPQEYVRVRLDGKEEGKLRLTVASAGWNRGGEGVLPAPMRPVPRFASVLFRLLACMAGLGLSLLLFPGAGSLQGVLIGGLWMALFFMLLRPLLLACALPLNLLFMGLATPFADALLILWASAWAPGLHLSYLQCVLISLLAAIAYAPYAEWKRRSLLPPLPSTTN